jgi:hypothetical protein
VCDLALEDIFKIDYFKEVHDDTKGFVTFINNHQATLAAWRNHTATDGAIDLTGQASSDSSKFLALLKPGETRFASAFLMLERTLKVRTRLEQFVVSDGWKAAIADMKRADKVGCYRLSAVERVVACICVGVSKKAAFLQPLAASLSLLRVYSVDGIPNAATALQRCRI